MLGPERKKVSQEKKVVTLEKFVLIKSRPEM